MISRTVCLASNVNTELLRNQLDQLHSEAHNTRRKANNARFRLLRLSEAAEKLRWQAARNLQIGKENDARELLLQKKKVMEALEKSKGRVELLDELASKLNEAISVKESQLVENVASDLEISIDDSESPVRIVSPTQERGERIDGENSIASNNSDGGKDQDLVHDVNNEAMLSVSEAEDITVLEGFSGENNANMLSSFKGVSSYIDLLENLDQKLYKIEEELGTILDLSTLILEDKEKPNNSRVLQISELLEDIRGTRAS